MPSATTILITGAGSGIGAATAGLAARRGHPLILLDFNADGVRATAYRMRHAALPGTGVSHTTLGITDLMTSLAIVFILLFAAAMPLAPGRPVIFTARRA